MPSSISASTSSTSDPRAPSSALEPPNVMLNVLDDDASHSSGYHCFLIQLKDCVTIEDTWIVEDESRRLDLSLLESYLRYTSSETSSFQSREIMKIIFRISICLIFY